MYQLNQTKDGYVVLLVNNRGVDKTQSGVARVDRRASVDVLVRTKASIKAAREVMEPQDLVVRRIAEAIEIPVRVPAGDLKVIQLTMR